MKDEHRERARKDAPKVRAVLQYLLDELAPWGAFTFHEASTGSKYVKFPHWALGSIQIRNHDGLKSGEQPRYAYKWTVRVDLPPQHRYGLYNPEELERLVLDFCGNADLKGILPGDEQTWEQFKGLPTKAWKEKKTEQARRGARKAVTR
jgi:hypothetical protein